LGSRSVDDHDARRTHVGASIIASWAGCSAIEVGGVRCPTFFGAGEQTGDSSAISYRL
jgi:hypothetical protein